MSAAIKTRTIVNYTGSITEMHGLWHISNPAEGNGRVELRSAYGLRLNNVRPNSYTTVDVPRLTARRAAALRALAARPGTPTPIQTDVRNWLIKAGLATVATTETETETTGRLRVTALGWEMSAALPAPQARY